MDVLIRRGDKSDIDSLRPLWVGVHRHHQDVMPHLAPYVSDDETWAARRRLYLELMEKPDTVLLLAEANGTTVGYGLAHVFDVDDSWLSDTWATGEVIGEIESLAVDPAFRGSGIGSRLLMQLQEALSAAGVEDQIIGVLPDNVAAIRLYQRHGYLPMWTYLGKRGTTLPH